MYVQLNLSSQQQYSDLENGKKHFTDEIVLRICEVFNISLLYFIHDQDDSREFKMFRHDTDFKLLQEARDNEHRLLLYKKMYIEAKLENIQLKLSALIAERNNVTVLPGKYRINVMI